MFLLKVTSELWEQNRGGILITEPEKIMGRIVKIAFGSMDGALDNFLEKTNYLFALPRITTFRIVEGWTAISYHLFETEDDRDAYELTLNNIADETAKVLGYQFILESVKAEISDDETNILEGKHIYAENPYGAEPISELREAKRAAQ